MSASQLADYAFTVRGNAYELDVVFKNREGERPVTGYSPSSTSVDGKLSIGRFPVAFRNEEEDKEPVHGQSKYLVIGVIPTIYATGPVPPAGSTKGKVGCSLPNNVFRPDKERPALRVVAPIKNQSTSSPGGVKLYALVDQDPNTGLCHAEIVNQEMVYYFSEYRTETKGLNPRKRDWNERVLAKSISSSIQLVSPKQVSGSVKGIDPLRSLFNQVSSHLSKFGVTADSTDLHDANALLNENAQGLAEPPLFLFIKRFLAVKADDEPFTHDEADDMCGCIQEVWGCIKHVQSGNLMLLHQGLKSSQIDIPLGDVYMFLTLGFAALVETPDDVGKTVRDVAKHVRLIVGSDSRTNILLPKPVLNNVSGYVQCLIRTIKSTRDEIVGTMDKLKGIHGTSMMPPEEVKKRLASVIDADDFRFLLEQSTAHWAFEYARGYRKTTTILNDLIHDLEKLCVSVGED